MIINLKDIAGRIDHTLLKPEATEKDIIKLCEEALKYGFASVCVNPSWVQLASGIVKTSNVKVCTVVGFPLGASSRLVKGIEANDAIIAGADEIDMVLNIGYLKSGFDELVQAEIAHVHTITKQRGKILKVIIETCLLNDDEKVRACLISKRAGAGFVKTSSGFVFGKEIVHNGATVEDVQLIRSVVGSEMGIKASGGIRDLDTALAMLEAGATRLGCSASVAIVEEAMRRS